MRNRIFGAVASKIFFIFYFLVSIVVYLISLVFVFMKSKNPKYKDALPARFLLKSNPSFENRDIWFHACSMGEVKALTPLVENVIANGRKVSISVVTNTGFEEAKKLCNDVRYLPFEPLLLLWIKKCEYLVVMEAELWYLLFFLAKMRRIKTVLINARISDKSVKSYEKFSFFYKMIFKNIDFVFAQSEIDKIRLERLGAKNIEISGNIKITSVPNVTKVFHKPDEFLIIAASTHANEESLILEQFDKSFGKMVIVPRHPERFSQVCDLVQKFCELNKLSFSKFSVSQSLDADLIVFDKMGELINLFAISDLVILGGAFEKIGGHNPIEPAFFSPILISGKNIFNQKALFDAVSNYYLIENNEIRRYLEAGKTLQKSSICKQGDIEKILKVINGKSL